MYLCPSVDKSSTSILPSLPITVEAGDYPTTAETFDTLVHQRQKPNVAVC